MKLSIKKNIFFIWIFLFIEVLILVLIKGSISDFESIGVGVVLLHVVITVMLLVSIPIKFSWLFVTAFVVRIIFMFWDLYARDIFTLPHSGADTELYYGWGQIVSKDLSYLSKFVLGGLYSKSIGVFFYFIGPLRIIAQYLNVLLGLMVLFFIQRILVLLKVEEKTVKTTLLFAAFFPSSIIMSAILLREILPTFLVTVSIYYFIKWYLSNNLFQFVWSLVFLALGAMFHSGVIGLALGYMIMFLFFDHSTKKYNFTIKNVFLFIPVLAFVFLFTTQFGDAMFFKFKVLLEGDEGDVYQSLGYATRGDSVYLEGMKINNPLQAIVFGPIKAIYFLLSPMPWDWRGVQDLVTFFIDSLLYGYVIYYFIRNKKFVLQNKQLLTILMIALLSAVFIYGIGVSNAGTAMRHRQKLIPVFLVMLGVMMHEKERTKLLLKKLVIRKSILKNENR